MIAAPTSVIGVITSSRISAAEHDRDDRVHVRVGGDARDRRVLQQPRVRAVGEPASRRRSGRRAPRPSGSRTRRGRRRPPRRRPAPTARITTPPSSICQPVATQRVAGSCSARRRERAARPHQRRRTRRRPARAADASLGLLAGRSSSATPAKPTSTAPMPARDTGSPAVRRSSMTHSGTDAISSAARFDGTSCSATVTTALAPVSRHADDQRAQELRARRAARGRRSERTTSITAPATTKRTPAPSSGGTVSTMTRMARYVEPQTM